MAHGQKRGKIDSVFEARVKELEQKAKSIAESFKSAYSTVRPWATPKDIKNLQHVPSMHMPAWKRFDINKLYSIDICGTGPKNCGTTGDLIGMKIQNEFLAVEERAFRLRHASYARCAALANGRFDTQGQTNKSSFSFAKQSIDAIIQAGGAVS